MAIGDRNGQGRAAGGARQVATVRIFNQIDFIFLL